MSDLGTRFSRSVAVSTRVAQLLHRRARLAHEAFARRLAAAYATQLGDGVATPSSLRAVALDPYRYAIDFAQRSILFWDTLRERGNAFLQHARAGLPPVLHFQYEVVLDARNFARPVNYALLRIVPPEGVTVDPKRRPYVIIDPRAGHGPGIGGFKEDSQVGIALRDGHPVYFVTFYPVPEPGQTLLDVCAAEAAFVTKVRELHPDSAKPVIIGNCQGGWAAMMLASANPDDTGPIVINGAPMSYWAGAFRDGAGDNPMRYAGGLLGGTWLASLASDLGNGKFDGAHLVQNFEVLNLSNTFWDKYYTLFANVDTEALRFLEFERWWGGFYLLNREEMEWITQTLFVGNELWSGEVKAGAGKHFDLRALKVPIVLFASKGDNITPPQQAFNWVADVYGSTEEIKARGQVIVMLLQEEVGHLGIFVSGKVARKEHARILSVLKSIEALPPGLYSMNMTQECGDECSASCSVWFEEQRLEDLARTLNRFQRVDEKPFQAVKTVAGVNQRAYDLLVRPIVQALASEPMAKLARAFHPMRVQRWALSDLNPSLLWLKPAAAMVRQHRLALGQPCVTRRIEHLVSDIVSASLAWVGAMRDAASEALFFQVYGNLYAFHLASRPEIEQRVLPPNGDAMQLPFVKEALSSIEKGGCTQAIARVCALLGENDVRIPLARIEFQANVLREYADLLPALTPDAWRRIRGEQDIIVRYARQRAIETLPRLLSGRADREHFLTLVAKLGAVPRLLGRDMNEHERSIMDAVIRAVSPPAALLPRNGVSMDAAS